MTSTLDADADHRKQLAVPGDQRRLAHHRAAGHLRRLHRPGLARPGAAHRGRRRGARRRVRDRRDASGRSRWASSPRRASRRRRSASRAAASRTCTAAAGTRRPASPTRTATASPPRSSTRPSAWCCATTTTPTSSRPASRRTTAGSPSTARSDPTRLLGCGQTAMRSPEEGIADLHDIQALGLRGRDDARAARRTSTTTTHHDWDPFWEAAIELGHAAVVPHPHDQCRPAPAGPKMNSFLSIVRGCQDIMAMLVLGGVFERHPDLRVVLRRGRRRLGAALHVPHGPRLQAPPLLAAGRPAAVAPAVGVLRREHLRHVPGRLDGVQAGRRHELAPADVGQRLPAQRLDVAVEPGDARRARPAPAPPSSSRRSCARTSPTCTASTSPCSVGTSRRSLRSLRPLPPVQPAP